MLRWRLLLGTLIIGAIVGLCRLDHASSPAWLPGAWLLPVALLFTLLGSHEIVHLARSGGMKPLAWVVYCGNALLLLSNWIPPIVGTVSSADGTSVSATPWPLFAMAIGLLAMLLGEMGRYERPGGVIVNAAMASFALLYVGGLISFAVQLRLTWGVGALASLIIVTKMGDTGAYTVGRLIGRHKMAPVLSPGKTLEGAAGALVFACLGAWGSLQWLVPAMTDGKFAPPSWWACLLFGVLVGTAGLFGDLAESLIKRDMGRKDSSDWLPGFGGVLDILDSILLAAPVAWFCWRVILT